MKKHLFGNKETMQGGKERASEFLSSFCDTFNGWLVFAEVE